jgi:hypothetical protein
MQWVNEKVVYKRRVKGHKKSEHERERKEINDK